MKYKEKPENKQAKKIIESNNLNESLDNIVSATRKVKPTPRMVAKIKLLVGNCFVVRIMFSLLAKVPSLIKRVLLARVVIKGTPIMVSQKTRLDHKLNSFDGLSIPDIENAKVNPALIPNQKKRFQKMVFDNHLVFLVFAGLTDRFLGEFCSLGIFLQNVAKSSISTCSNYWFKTYSFIISKSHHALKAIMQVMVVFLLCLQGVCNAATPVNNRDIEDINSLIAKAEIQNKIPKGLLAAIAKVESGHREYAINVGGRSVYAGSFAKALSIAKSKIDAGITNIDLGVMQLNYRWHGDQFANLDEMLTPKKNINYAAKLLQSIYSQYGNWQKAIRHYHSANLKHSRKYSRKVSMVWLASN